jgi:hypothetical protein
LSCSCPLLFARFPIATAVFAILARSVGWLTGRQLVGHLLAGMVMNGIYLAASYWAVAHGLACAPWAREPGPKALGAKGLIVIERLPWPTPNGTKPSITLEEVCSPSINDRQNGQTRLRMAVAEEDLPIRYE